MLIVSFFVLVFRFLDLILLLFNKFRFLLKYLLLTDFINIKLKQKKIIKNCKLKLSTMQNIQQVFHKHFKLWTEKQKEFVQNFFLNNQFISKFYQTKKFNQIAKICFYRKLNHSQKLLLENNNRSEVIILLQGDVIIKKKQRKLRKRPRIKDQNQQKKTINIDDDNFQYIFLSRLKNLNDTIRLNSQSIIQSSETKSSEILFIPCSLYYKLLEDIENQRVSKIQHVLQKFFFKLKKKELHQLSQSNCIFRQFKMNNYIYRASSKPEEIFVLLQGIVKLQKPGFSQQTLKQTILITEGRIFGEIDLKLQQRTKNAVACSALVQVLTIPKSAFLKFASKAFPDLVFETQSISPTKLPNIENLRISRSLKPNLQKRENLLPLIRKSSHFHQASFSIEKKKSQSQQKRQYQLIKNSHMLVDLKQLRSKKLQIKNYSPKSKEEVESLIKRQKNKLKQLKISSRFSFDNSLLDL